MASIPSPSTGDPVVDELIRTGQLTPASEPGGIAALLAIQPVPASTDQDVADVVSELRAERI
ncbi:MAG TPA: hypothetical protein VMU51_32435 [Mycobacteriales bacterium]|nr:hypothetical protein [Mycobacteriales bacterium]